jgi:chemotaxis protein MotB
MALGENEEELENLLNKGALWAVTYGDLMSYLMIFFLMLFIFSVSGEGRMAAGLAAVQKEFGGKNDNEALKRQRTKEKELDVAATLKNDFRSRGLQKFASVEVTERRVRVTLSEPVLFASGQAVLKESAMPVLGQFADSVRLLPNLVVVEGYTDNVPISRGPYPSNWELSMARAASVLKYLIKSGVDPSRVSGVGYAEFRPVAPNDTADGRAKNRRIELSLLRRGE